ncbi:hypothetical protein [Endozoicomonas ascidiicola]|uniref:hypothetical protein n=1 Tax=Endozoicomonas ascidiicola TaxID=1698521 RepID=UPI000832CBD2|nr:hypothetical protein [Endozoicomonas ascidiicola]
MKKNKVNHNQYRVAAILIHPDDHKYPVYKAVLSGLDGTAYQAEGRYEDVEGKEAFPTIPVIDDRLQKELYNNDQSAYECLIESVRSHAYEAYLDWQENRGPYNEIYASLRLEELRGLNFESEVQLNNKRISEI